MTLSIQKRLKRREISFEEALQCLVYNEKLLDLKLLDGEICIQFFQKIRNTDIPPIVPLLLWQNCYYLGCPVPITLADIQNLSDRLSSQVKIIPIDESSYRQWFRQYNLRSTKLSSSQLVNPLTGESEQEDITQVTEFHLARLDNQIDRIKAIIAGALRNRASDIHLEPTVDGLRVRYRIDGILRHITTLPPEIGRKVIVSLKVMCNMDIADSRRPQDGRISERYIGTQQQEQGLDLRVSTLPCVSGQKGEPGEKAVLRLLKQENSFTTIDNLGFSARTLEIYKHWLKQPQGMIVFTGPTGSGKTSTLYTSLQTISTDSVNIITVEDPVEYVLPGITQTQVNEVAGMTLAAGLRAILRQDPDIIMIGEIRDEETAETAVRAALTGHLVLTTLHTNDAIGVIPRLKDIGPDPGLISDALLGVVAQRLVRRICPHCIEPYEPTESDLKTLSLTLEEASPKTWRHGRGCPKCFNSGYLGREAIIELLNIDDTIRQIIHEGSITTLNHYLDETNFDSFRSAAISKVTSGITTVEEIRRVLPYSSLARKASIHPKTPPLTLLKDSYIA
jgi:type II secretory ATPase GspE/PulE/Tfp pilus assembly ATPase PilB-like protein